MVIKLCFQNDNVTIQTLKNLYDEWGKAYLTWVVEFTPRFEFDCVDDEFKTNRSETEESQDASNKKLDTAVSSLDESFKKLLGEFKTWCNSNAQVINAKKTLNTKSDEIHQITIIGPIEICQLPWKEVFHLKGIQCEVFFSLSDSSPVVQLSPPVSRSSVRILPILGNDKNINTKADLENIKNISNHKLPVKLPEKECLNKPKRQEFYAELWKDWDVIITSSHSKTEDGIGWVDINDRERISVQEFSHTLDITCRRLKLIIFNSCDGFGLAQALANSHIPCVIVFRTPVLDEVAQRFLNEFFDVFAKQDKSLAESMHQAREALKGMEKDYPCASFLPVVFHNPNYDPLTWQSLTGNNIIPTWEAVCKEMLRDSRANLLDRNPLSTDMGGFGRELVEISQSFRLKSKSTQNHLNTIPESTESEFFEHILSNPNSQGKRIIITAESGTGKSTLLHNLGDWILEKKPNNLVIFIPLVELREQDLETYLRKWISKAEKLVKLPPLTEENDRLIDLFSNHQVWLLFDSVDEWQEGGINPLTKFISWLNPYISAPSDKPSALAKCIAKNASIVLTCKSLTWRIGRGAVLNFDSYELLSLNNEQRDSIIKRCSGNNPNLLVQPNKEDNNTNPSRSPEELIASLQNTHLEELLSNILNLLLFCRCYELNNLLKNRTQIYEDFINKYHNEEIARFQNERELFYTALGKLALKSLEQKSNQIPVSLIEKVFKEYKKNSWHEWLELATNSAWLKQINDNYIFPHPSYQAFLAARVLEDGCYFLPNRIFERQWTEVIFFWIGRSDLSEAKKEDFLKQLVNFDDKCGGFFNKRALLLAKELINKGLITNGSTVN